MYNNHIIVHIIVYFCDTQMLKAPESKFRYDRDIEFEDAPAPRRRGGFAAKYDDPQPDIDALLSVVGSKRARDIVRKNRFMSKAAFVPQIYVVYSYPHTFVSGILTEPVQLSRDSALHHQIVY